MSAVIWLHLHCFKGIPNFKDTRIAMLRAETLPELNGILDHIESTFGGE